VRPTGLFNAAIFSLLLWLALLAVVALVAYVLYAVL
jgi:hypothetical protein